MNRRSLLTTAALASASVLTAAGALAAVSPPAAVDEALQGYGKLSPTVSYLLEYAGPRGQWQAGFNAHTVQFIGSAIKTFILAQTLRDAEQGKLSEDDQWAVDDSVRSLSSPVFLNLTGTTTARSVLEAMIAHSDNTATDIALAKVGPGAVRALVAEAGLTQTRLADSTRRMFSYLAGAPAGVDLGWAGIEKAQSGTMPGPARAAMNDQEAMVSTADEMVRWYRQALAGAFFEKPGTLAEFKRIQAMADAIPMVVPANVLGFGKGGSIDWEDFHCIAVAGQMVSGSATVTFSFILNWTGTNDTIIGDGVSYMKKALAAAAGEFTA